MDEYLLFHKDAAKTVEEIAKFSKKDAKVYQEYEQYLSKFCNFWEKNVDNIPYNYLQKPTFFDKINFLKKSYQKDLDYFDFGKFLTCSVE